MYPSFSPKYSRDWPKCPCLSAVSTLTVLTTIATLLTPSGTSHRTEVPLWAVQNGQPSPPEGVAAGPALAEGAEGVKGRELPGSFQIRGTPPGYVMYSNTHMYIYVYIYIDYRNTFVEVYMYVLHVCTFVYANEEIRISSPDMGFDFVAAPAVSPTEHPALTAAAAHLAPKRASRARLG